MGTDLLVFAVVMACLAAAVVIVCVVAESSEAWAIRRDGWARGHRRAHVLGHHD